MQKRDPPSPSMITRWKSCTFLRTSGPPSPAASAWTWTHKRCGFERRQNIRSSLHARKGELYKLSVKTKMAVYNACLISTLLYESEMWTTYAKQEWRLNASMSRAMYLSHTGNSWKEKLSVCLPSSLSSGYMGSPG